MKIHSHNSVPASKPVQAAQSAPRKNDAREAVPAAAVPTGNGETPSAPSQTRLDAYAQKIEKRFDSALASNALSPRQQQALEQERDRFHSMIARFEAAYMESPESAKMDKAAGMQKLLDSFGKSVSHILSGGEVAAQAAPTTNTAQRPGRGGIDTTA